jgi:hypothetical protein
MYWRKPGGYTIITDPDRGVREMHSFTCKHCCRVTFVASGCDPAEAGGYCTCCDALICKYCAGHPCDHIEKKLERAERLRELIQVGGRH